MGDVDAVEFKDFASIRLFICWLLVIVYTVLVIEDVGPTWRILVLSLFLSSILYLLFQIINKREQLKTTIWLAFTAVCSGILLILHTLELIDNVMLSGFLTGIVVLQSISWCFLSHVNQVTEAGWHWYIWSLTILAIICILTVTLDVNEHTSTLIYVSNIIFVILLHIRYIYDIYVSNAQNLKCVRNIMWVVCSGIVSLLLLVGLLTFGLNDINSWLMYALGIEIFIACGFLLDIGLLFCCSKTHTYTSVPSNVVLC